MNAKAAFLAVILTAGIVFYGLYEAFEAESVDDLKEKLAEGASTISKSREPGKIDLHFNCIHSFSDFPSSNNFGEVSLEEVDQFVEEILAVAGLSPNFKTIEIPQANCFAFIKEDERFIGVNTNLLGSLQHRAGTDWAVKAILAHEIGHHLNGHTLDEIGSRPPTELEADKYCGNILAKLGASLEEAQLLFPLISNNEVQDTHPYLKDRLAAVEEGWNAGRKLFDTTESKYSTTENFIEQARVEDLEFLRSINHSSQSWALERPNFLQETSRFDPFHNIARAARFERGLENSRQQLYSLYEPLMEQWRQENPNHFKTKSGPWSDADKRRWISWFNLKGK